MSLPVQAKLLHAPGAPALGFMAFLMPCCLCSGTGGSQAEAEYLKPAVGSLPLQPHASAWEPVVILLLHHSTLQCDGPYLCILLPGQ